MSRLLLLVVVLLGCAAFAADGGAPKPIVAVLYFDVRNENDAELMVFRKGMAELLINDLVNADIAQVVERDRLEEIIKEQDFQASGRVDPKTAQQLGKLLGAEYLVMGSMMRTAQGTIITVRVNSELKGQTTFSKRALLLDGDILGAQATLAEQLIGYLSSAGALPPPKAQKKTGQLPYKTAVKYAQALDAKDKKDVKAAKQKLTEVLEEQPEFALAKVDLLSLMNQ